jgi:hypothetical protein
LERIPVILNVTCMVKVLHGTDAAAQTSSFGKRL